MSDRFRVQSLPLPGLMLLERHPLCDERGFLERLFCRDTFHQFGIECDIRQMNHTLTRRQGTVRGMHYQVPPYTETKIVTCLRGEVFDVVVDLRPESPTFLQWHGEYLSQDNAMMMVIPEGFAHGFQSTLDNVELLYLHSKDYHQCSERGISPLDPRLCIDWPTAISCMSERDKALPFIDF
ncbi:dTDP-4-dehydrorhamnose 3,5-epimerase [Limnothrix sp. PR1529]|uniref:dTDP-4-dehydrorhamnose 3,5-epimerase family protein n=1 Tax=Limnothrix sp. PR1529 TaxID=1704291 RepID=UPI00081E2147|nr:dTDP-4-dehydrorhamnose 3,5-epimerase [Limnothrix sp. P13C2]PIB05439.1 dTDP-4-dehydrorhamnose 3,5-epimerase [Limnothrix sp. PR1529]